MLNSIFAGCTERPHLVLLTASICVLVCLPGLAKLELETDGRALVPREAPAAWHDAKVRELFGVSDQIVVVVEPEPKTHIYTNRTLTLVATLSRDLAAVIPANMRAGVMSLATERRDRVYPGTLRFRTFLDSLPASAEELLELRRDVVAVQLFEGTLVSKNESAAAILVGTPSSVDRVAIVRKVRELIDTFSTEGHRIRVVGAPIAESQLGLHILSDLVLLVPMAVVVLSATLYVLTGSVWIVVLGGVEVLVAILATFALMGYFGVPVYISTAILPVTLTATAAADEIHILGRYLQRLGADDARHHSRLILETMNEVSPAVIVTALTTAVAFLSFLSSPIIPIRAFGVFECIGVLISMLWSLSVTPAALALIPPSRFRRDVGVSDWIARSLVAASEIVARRRRPIVVATFVLLVVSLPIASQVQVQDGWIEGFSQRSDFFRDSSYFDEHFSGTHILRITYEAHPSHSLHDPELLSRIGTLEKQVETLPSVGGVLGLQEQIAVMHYLIAARQPAALVIPSSAYEVREVLRYARVMRGEQRVREFISDDGTSGLATVFLKRSNFRDTEVVMTAVETIAQDLLSQYGVSVGFAGDVAVSQAMIPAVVQSQISSLFLTLLGVILITLVLTRSLSQGLMCVFPPLLASFCTLSMMTLSGIPLGVATSMFCAITVGVGTDYSIHLTMTARRFANSGASPTDSVRAAVVSSGYTIVIDALCIGLAFSVLVVSQVPANVHLGIMVASGILTCCAITLLALPAVLMHFPPAFLLQVRCPAEP